MLKPTILLVPDLWEGPTVYDRVVSLLQGREYTTQTCALTSTGTSSPENPSMKDDIATIRAKISALAANGEEIVLILHSASGFLGSEAMEAFDVKSSKERGETGGVKGIVFLTAGLAPKGHQHGSLPFFDFKVSLSLVSYETLCSYFYLVGTTRHNELRDSQKDALQ